MPLPRLTLIAAALCTLAGAAAAQQPWVQYQTAPEAAKGKHIVLVSGDEEYRSEEALPALARILTFRHGFTCTVLFAIDPESGEINPMVVDNIPGLEQLEHADLMIHFTRFRNLPGDQMAPFIDYLRAGKPVLGIRTSTHAFRVPAGDKYHRYSFDYAGEDFDGGFGRQVLGETWIAHHGHHGVEGTRGVIAPGAEDHPITNGIDDDDIFGPTDVYEVRLPLTGGGEAIILGQVTESLEADSEPVAGEKNDPMMPIVWTRTYELPEGEQGRAVTSTIGAAVDLESEGTRRVLVNAAYWLLGLDVPEKADVRFIGDFDPSWFGMNEHQKGVKPRDLGMDAPETE